MLILTDSCNLRCSYCYEGGNCKKTMSFEVARKIIDDNLSIGACVENMCLRATDLGLGSLWIRDISCVAHEIEKMLNKEELELNCALSIGYQSKFPKMRPRKKIEEIVEWY